jgi:NAD(P)H-dependent FMN reductase
MPHIAIISASIRTGRNSHRVALYFKNYLVANTFATAEIIDLKAYNFPLFEDTLKTQKKPTVKLLEFAQKIAQADGIIIVTPEYNGGYPASLKNAIDVLYDEWHRKPISISTVSAGVFGGSQALVSLQFSLWKIGAWTVTNMFPVSKVQDAFTEEGKPTDKTLSDKMAKVFIAELLKSVALNVKTV